MRLWLILLLLLGCVSAGMAQEQDSTESLEQLYAPYVYMARYPIYQLAPTAEATGMRYFSLAFILGGEICEARWMGSTPLTGTYLGNFLLPDLEALRAMGGDVIVSFGGYGGTELAQVCTDVETLTAEYQRVIDTYNLTRVDFDIEGDDIRQPDVIDRRSQAIAQLQAQAAAAGRELHVSFTLPVQPTGLTGEGLSVLESALAYGVEIERVNIMTMNFGEDFPPDLMGANTIQAAQSLYEQLARFYPEADDTLLWNRIGLTPMVGMNDRQSQIFQLTDAEQVTAFALEQNIGLLAMWSLDRDQACDFAGTLSNKCSSIEQEPYAFSAIFNRVLTIPE